MDSTQRTYATNRDSAPGVEIGARVHQVSLRAGIYIFSQLLIGSPRARHLWLANLQLMRQLFDLVQIGVQSLDSGIIWFFLINRCLHRL